MRGRREEIMFRDVYASIHKAIFKYFKNAVHTTLHEDGVMWK